ncbi:MAG TPA: FAD-dependent oxidoreductase [Patescibacteria group bacterium]|nr:FAD-dependent oxidoreductase [Patescibacteria group bacterium]
MKAELVKKTEEAKGTKSFFWKLEKKINWLPGQYFYYTLPKLNYPDSRGATRHFTISSSPTEGDLLQLTTRIREESGYKKTLDDLPIGTIVEGEGPNGTLILDEKEANKNHVFLAGGIGITPFRSFIKYNVDNNLKIPMYLIYSNSNSDFVFKKELEKLAKDNNFINIEFLDTSKSGHLDKLKIEKLIENWNLEIRNCTFWLVGPPSFVDAIETTLEKLKINGDQLRSEKFTGY